jgi:hypothetical protein
MDIEVHELAFLGVFTSSIWLLSSVFNSTYQINAEPVDVVALFFNVSLLDALSDEFLESPITKPLSIIILGAAGIFSVASSLLRLIKGGTWAWGELLVL